MLKYWKLSDGELVSKVRLPNNVNLVASPVVTPLGQLYFASGGISVVIGSGPAFGVLATNDLHDPSSASPAVAGGRIYIKGGRNLYCIAMAVVAEARNAEKLQPRLMRTADSGRTFESCGNFSPVRNQSARALPKFHGDTLYWLVDGGVTWSAPLVPPSEMNGVGGLSWLEYDPKHDTLYLMKMGSELYQLRR